MNRKSLLSNVTRRDALKISCGAMLSSSTMIFPSLPEVQGNPNKKTIDAKTFPFLIIRLHPRHHRDPMMLAEMLQLMQSKPGLCNEVWFCTEMGFPPIEQHRESADLMAKAADEIRKLSIAPGLQIANTIGHGGTYTYPVMAAGKQRLVGHDGALAPSCNCPRDKEFLEYQRQLADIYASAIKPSSIWIDDDLRMNAHPPVQYGCFCDHCLADFALFQGRPWTREELVTELVQSNHYRQLALDWVQFCMSSLADIATVISAAATKRAPACRMGLQQCSLDWNSYYGPDLKQIFDAMEKASGKKPGSRLGHGYYTDHEPRAVLIKSLGIARQVERAGNAVEQICPEVENTNHTAMGKSARGTAIESTLHLAMGCNSLSYALWNDAHLEGPEWMELFLEKFASWHPLWQLMVEYNANSALGGLDITFGAHHTARPIDKQDKPWESWKVHSDKAMQLAALGLPLCPDSPLACASLLTAEAADGLTNTELQQLFSTGVLLDGAAIAHLQKKNPGFDVGVSGEWIKNSGACEVLTGDPLNGIFKEVRWSQFEDAFFKLHFSAGKQRTLGEMHTLAPKDEILGCATAIYENELGGRVGVLGYNGFQNIVSTAKRIQLLKMADWVAHGKLPAILETSAQVAVFPRLDKNTGALNCVTLLNVSIGETQTLSLRLRHAKSDAVIMYSAEGAWKTNLKTYRESSDLLVTVPPLSPWGIVFLSLA